MKHFANFIWLNATRFDVTGLPTNVFGMAFKSSTSKSTQFGTAKASLILMNMGSSAVSVQPSQAGLGRLVGGAQTSPAEDWETLRTSSSVSLPALSITTLLFD